MNSIANDIATALKLKYAPVIFRNHELATTNAHRSGRVVMLGDDDLLYVVCMADSARLERAGYEYA